MIPASPAPRLLPLERDLQPLQHHFTAQGERLHVLAVLSPT